MLNSFNNLRIDSTYTILVAVQTAFDPFFKGISFSIKFSSLMFFYCCRNVFLEILFMLFVESVEVIEFLSQKLQISWKHESGNLEEFRFFG